MRNTPHPWVAPEGFAAPRAHLSFEDMTVCALCGETSPCSCYVPEHVCDVHGCDCGDSCPCCLEELCSCPETSTK